MATLFINRSDSRCGDCRRPADLSAKAHDEVIGYVPGPGCGATFTSVSSDYSGMGIEDAAKAARPDLPFLPFGETETPPSEPDFMDDL